MAFHRFRFPRQATINHIDNLLRVARETKGLERQTIVFDLAKTHELSSIFICFICALADRAREFGNEVRFELPPNRETADTLRAIKKIVPKAGRPSLMLSRGMCQLRKIASNYPAPIDDVVTLAGDATGMSEPLREDVQLLLRELLTNAIDHSGSGECYLCAGKWGKGRFVHFTLLDFGVGIPAKLRTRFQLKSDLDAIQGLLSSGKRLTTRVGREGGRGYETIQDVMRRTRGGLSIYSGQAKAVYRYDCGKYKTAKGRSEFTGTCVDLAFDLDHVDSVDATTPPAREIF